MCITIMCKYRRFCDERHRFRHIIFTPDEKHSHNVRLILASHIWESIKMIRTIFCIQIGKVIYYNLNYLESGVFKTSQ